MSGRGEHVPERTMDEAADVVLVTGAGSGIGRAVARAFASRGVRLGLLGRRSAQLVETAAGLTADRAICLPCDITDRAAVQRALSDLDRRFGSPNVLVNNAGMNIPRRSLAELEPGVWDRMLEVNLTGAFNMVRAVLPEMRRRGRGTIINIASIAGLRASRIAGPAYSAAKHGLVALNHAINEEAGGDGVRATVVCPGEVDTPILDQRPRPVDPVRRQALLQPEDVAEAVLFAASLPDRACVAELVITPVHQGFG